MVVGADLVDLAKWLDPVTTVLVGAAIVVYIRYVLKPRLADVEQTQEARGDRLDDRELDAQEHTLLIDDNAGRIDQVEEATERLKKRVRRLEQSFASEHNRPPRTHAAGRSDGSTPTDAAAESADGDGDDGDDDPGRDRDDGAMAVEQATHRLRERAKRIRNGVPSRLPTPGPTTHHRRHGLRRGDD